MKSILLFLILSQLPISIYGQKKQTNNNYTKSYVDSAIFYFKQSKTANRIDSLLFERGVRISDSIPTDDNSVLRIHKAAEDFKGIKQSYYYNRIELSILYAFDNAKEYYKEISNSKAIINRYDAAPNRDDKALFLIVLSNLRIPFRVSDKLNDGFDFYTTKLKFYLQRNDSAAISECYFALGGFYRTKGLNDLSIYYYKKSIPYLDINDTINDTSISGRLGWANNTAVVGHISNVIGDYQNGILYSRAALNIRVPSKVFRSDLSYIYKNLAYAKIMLKEPDSVLDLINQAIKYGLTEDDPTNITNSYLVKGIYFQKVNQPDSSEFYLQECNNVIAKYNIARNSTSGILNPNYYLALGKINQNRFKDAEFLLKSEIPKLGNFREEVMNEYKLLVEVYLKLGDLENSKAAFRSYKELQEQLQEDERKNRKMSFETEQKIADAESTITNLTTEKKIAAISRNYLTGIAALLLIIALVIYNRFRITRSQKKIIEKEKQRSETLLLNILPAEVAEELKAKGSADAKQFDDVTVMFTDFKNFTQISETLTPSELVAEIHKCFKAFDDIISKHNIEKIKTIGDAYMCAGGLPVANKTNANDVVSAAIEIQQFMKEHLQQRKNENKEPFEIRIGIHTGPVVAGIVGVKKFAYDIWGDTVNIASRMESSGEAGKINISGSTYELVKEKFACIHRGKIEAKNKGTIDMYFVE